MDLYFSPLACSMASRIAFYEAGIPANFVNVKSKKTPDGRDFLEINARGQVPALKLEDGEVLTENIAILEYIADLKPEAKLAPQGIERTRMRKWLGLINSEVHVGALGPVLSASAPAEAKTYATERATKALKHIDAHLAGRDWLTGSFSVADAYLATVSNWLQATPIKLSDFPNIAQHQQRVFSRPAAGRALNDEVALYRAA